ncbi:MAG: hypothetical protein ACLQHS_05375 [Candidatus Limnocylindrales bacterium]
MKDISDGTPHLPFTSLGAAGALVTTADDLARWALQRESRGAPYPLRHAVR